MIHGGLFLTLLVQGPSIHVAPHGRETNPGTWERPVASLARALELVQDATEPSAIVLHEGVYAGDVQVGRQGDHRGPARAPLTIEAARRPDGSFENVVFDGARAIEQAEPLAGRPGLFKIPGKFSYRYRTHVWEADTRVRYTLVADLAAVERYPASFWHTDAELILHTSDGRPPAEHRMGASGASNGITVWRPNTLLRGLRFRNFLAWQWSCGVELRAPDTAAEDCRVENSVRGIQVLERSPRMRVTRCRVDDCGGGVYSQGLGALIEDCRLFKIRDAFMVPVYPQDDTAIQYYSPASAGEVRGNLGVGFANGIFVKCDGGRFVVERNTMVEGISFGIGCTGWHAESVFRHNIVTGFSEPVLAGENVPKTAVIDFNLLHGPRAGDALETLRGRGTNANSIAADPLFAAPGKRDYRLLPRSPALKIGGALGAVDAGFKDVEPPVVDVRAAEPAREESPGAWLTAKREVELQIDARDAFSAPTKVKTRLDDGPWTEPEPFQPRLRRSISGSATIGVQVSDAAGNWSAPATVRVRVDERGPRLSSRPRIHAGANGASVAFASDAPCKAKLEFGPTRSYGSVLEHSERGVFLLKPLPEKTCHARIVLEDALGRTSVGDDVSFAFEGEARTWRVVPDGPDVERTLQFAVDRALPGDRILLAPGLYAGETILTHGGVASAPLTIEAEQPGTAILDGKHESPACLRLVKAPHVVIRGLEIRWFGKADAFYSSGKAGVVMSQSPDVTVADCRIWNDFWMGWPIGSGIYAAHSPGLTADRNVIFQVEQGIYLYFSPRCRVTRNTILSNMYGAVQFLYSTEESVSRNNSFCFGGNDAYVVWTEHEKEFSSFRSDYNNLGTGLRSPDPGGSFTAEDPFFKGWESKAVIMLNGKRYHSLKAWREATGQDARSIFKDPRYVDSERWDFRLKPDSPNIAAGEDGQTIGVAGDAWPHRVRK
jgi:parallel beta-helix repeat protein